MKTTYRKFEANRQKANASCPCGKSNRDGKFATEKGFGGKPVGHCHSCGEDFWNDDDTIVKPYEVREEDIPVFCSPSVDEIAEYFDSELKSDFVKYLISMFGEDATREAVELYYLGVIDSVHGTDQSSDVIFWQIDSDKNPRAAKMFQYNKQGKRQGFPRWWHKHNNSNCQVNQYFFGGHLIDDYDKGIAVVESEKTAVTMSICQPNFIWIASGGLTNLNDSKCSSISQYDVTLFPDVGCYDKWNEIAEKWDFQISRECELWMKEGLIDVGDDIADHYLQLAKVLSPRKEKYDDEWDDFVDDNPELNLDKN